MQASTAGMFEDLDNQSALDSCISRALTSDCRNLAVEFAASKARAALNIAPEDVERLHARKVSPEDPSQCLWLNLWGWTREHQAIVKSIGQRYNLSARLVHTMCPDIRTNTPSGPRIPLGKLPASPLSSPLPDPAASMADIFDAVWHFGTVDVGRRYICLGWNALFFLPNNRKVGGGSKPNALRVWSTVLLCDDGTVLSVFEAPATVDSSMITRVRQNQVNVVRNLSKAKAQLHSALMLTPIRPATASTAQPTELLAEMSGLVFYYLFDDWLDLFFQASGSEHSYRRRLEFLRQEMMVQARSEQIDSLHQVGKQLTALRSICKSYQSMIAQLLRNQRALFSRERTQSECRGESMNSSWEAMGSIRLPLTIRARFERLQDRIDLCMMTELDECIDEKDGLVQMNYNLIALKQAQTVERLTRTTVLLAKVTIIFLPISVATSYFSMQIKVVTVVTIIFLVGFEWLSARNMGNLVYTGLTRRLLDEIHRRRDGNGSRISAHKDVTEKVV